MAKMHITLETGTVAAIEDHPGRRIALVAMDPPEGGEEGCATCRMCSAKDGCERMLPADIDDETAISRGMRVEVEITRPSLYLPIFMTLLLPLVGIVAGGMAGFALSSGQEWQDMLSALLAFVGGAAFFGLGYLLLRQRAKLYRRSARIRRTLQDEA